MRRLTESKRCFILAFLCLFSALASAGDPKLVNLEDINVTRTNDAVNLDLSFNQNFTAKSLRPIYERNFVQFVVNGVGVNSAKLIPVPNSNVEKIFVYQYAPGIARVRLILKNDNQWAKGRIRIWNASGNRIRFSVKDVLAQHAPKNVAVASAASAEEQVMLKEVVKNTKEISDSNGGTRLDREHGSSSGMARVTPTAPVVSVLSASAKGNLAPDEIGVKHDPSQYFLRMALSLLGVVGLFIAAAFGLKKYAGKLDLKKLPFGKKERLIQVVATHRLGKSQAISLVKITGEYMVIGLSGESVSLITKLGSEVDVEKYLEDRYWGGAFEKHLKKLGGGEEKPVSSFSDISGSRNAESGTELPNIETRPAPRFAYDGVRDVGASTGMSAVRAAIKEKTTNLKQFNS